jgi:integrase
MAALLTLTLWRDLAEAMSPEQIQTLIDRWLTAQLDADADARSRVDWSSRLLMTRCDSGKPQLVERLSHDDVRGREVEALLLGEDWPQPDQFLADPDLELAAHEQGTRLYDDASERHRTGDSSIAESHVDALLAEAGITLEAHERTVAVRCMMNAHVALMGLLRKRRSARWRPLLDPDPAGRFGIRIEAGGNTTPAVTLRQGSSISPTISEAVARSLEEFRKQGSTSAGRLKDYEAAFRHFGGWMGHGATLADVTANVAGEYRLDLVSAPANARKLPVFRDLKVREQIAHAKAVGHTPTLNSTTINNKYITPLRALFQWAVSSGLTAENPFDQIKIPSRGVRSNTQRKTFTDEQLQQIFNAPVFTGAAGARGQKLYQPGTIRTGGWRYWIPLMALYSGARLNELCGLDVENFEEREGVTFFHVSDAAPHQRVKTKAGHRMVPVHPALIELGLLSHLEAARSGAVERLFPDIDAGPRGYLSHAPSKFFGRVLDGTVGKDTGLVFHSFRHTFITALRRAGVPKDVRMRIVGHEDGDTHDSYGDDVLPILNDAVSRVTYPGLDLSRVRHSGASRES